MNCRHRFLLAKLQLETIMRRVANTKTLFDLLEKMPSGMDEMYCLTLERINEQPDELASLAHRFFVWLLYHHKDSKLRVEDIQHALAVSVDTHAYDERAVTPVDVILSACHGLVIAAKQPGFGEDGTMEFRFVRK